jgi:phosphatidylserine synthase 2
MGAEVDKSKHTYDDNCELTWANFWDNLDHYYLVHWVDWFCCTFMMRDSYLLHFNHVTDEILELSWEHILPHFAECWWDHLICDILLSNIPAIIVGFWVQKKIGLI